MSVIEGTNFPQLANNICRVVFTKKDGSEREMVCTTNSNWLPPTPEGAGTKKAVNMDVMNVWELNVGWRSFIRDNVISLEVLSEEEENSYAKSGS